MHLPFATQDAPVHRIQIALLLDTSGSMDGLLEQAKAQLWKMVNELAKTKKNGKAPDIELALYEYGKEDFSANNEIHQITPFTQDLDLVSEELFKLTTNGGDEYCGQVIHDAVQELAWSKSNKDLKIIIIAGNEPFTQGSTDYKEACKSAISQGIMVNTIFCGVCEEGVRSMWKDGADRADGKYMCINQNEAIVHIETPFDDQILELNDTLNRTYLGYGHEGKLKAARQKKQDANAASMGKGNMAARAAAKSSTAYKNASWDVVDAFEENEEQVATFEEDELPEVMQEMDKESRVKFLKEKSVARAKLQTQIQHLNQKRESYISKARAENAKAAGNKANTLDEVMLKAIREQAEANAFYFEQ